MPALDGLEWTFDTAAQTYEKIRPGYVPELYKAIFEYRFRAYAGRYYA